MKPRNLGRRMFLRGAGGVAIGLPFLELTATTAHGGGPSVPHRFLIFQTPQGTINDQFGNEWTPSATGANYSLSPMLAPLADHQSDLLVISGVDNAARDLNVNSNGHNSAGRTLLTSMPYAENIEPDGSLTPAASQAANGEAGGASIDQVVADLISGSTQFKSLEFGIGDDSPRENRMLYAGPSDQVQVEDNPLAAFDRMMFDNGVGDDFEPTTIQQIRARRGSILDLVGDGFNDLNARLGAADRRRLDAHLGKIRELEQRVEGSGFQGEGCSEPDLSYLPGGYNYNDRDQDDLTAQAFVDLAVMGLACDQTRVTTLQFTDYQAPSYAWLDFNLSGFASYHDLIHDGRTQESTRQQIRNVMLWQAQMFGQMLTQMGQIVEGDGTLLDHTLVMWISEFSNGGGHNSTDLPIVLAGNLSGAVQTGRHISRVGERTGELYTTILNLFGSDAQSFGWPSICDGPMSLS